MPSVPKVIVKDKPPYTASIQHLPALAAVSSSANSAQPKQRDAHDLSTASLHWTTPLPIRFNAATISALLADDTELMKAGRCRAASSFNHCRAQVP